jgi:hypothetical protein
MVHCKRCLEIGVIKDGGRFGCCPEHQKRRCPCGRSSLGFEYCPECEATWRQARYWARANFQHVDPARIEESLEFKDQILHRAKLLFFEAVDVGFLGLHNLLLAFHHSGLGVDRKEHPPEVDHKKAA